MSTIADKSQYDFTIETLGPAKLSSPIRMSKRGGDGLAEEAHRGAVLDARRRERRQGEAHGEAQSPAEAQIGAHRMGS